MALLVDESIPSVPDLLSFDGGLMDMAGTEEIDLQGKLAMARSEIATRVHTFLMDCGENADVLGTVVVTEPLKRWILSKALAFCFRDGHFRHLSDRYKEKCTAYERLCDSARDDLMRMGVGRTLAPLRRPSTRGVSTVSGSLPEGSYAIALSAVAATGEESEVGEATTIHLDHEAGLRVEAPLLNEPAVSWNTYVGRSAEALRKQNESPLPAGGFIALDSLSDYGLPGTGQQPSIYTREVRKILRG